MAWIPSVALAAHLVPARQLEARERRGRLATGVEALDRLLGGGWPRGALSELVGGRSSGRTALALSSIAEALRRHEAVALVDVGGALDPRAAARAGVPLGRLLWVRCAPDKALAAAEVVLSAGGFGLLALDLGDARAEAGGPRPTTAAWLRLKRGTERHGTAVLVTAERRPQGALGACAVALSARARFAGGAAPLLVGLDAQATAERGGAAAETPPIPLEHRAD